MSGMLWGALVGALIGLWGGMQRSAAVNGGRVSFHGADLLILIFGALVAALVPLLEKTTDAPVTRDHV